MWAAPKAASCPDRHPPAPQAPEGRERSRAASPKGAQRAEGERSRTASPKGAQRAEGERSRRLDPPCLRASWTAACALSGAAFRRDVERRLAHAGWSEAQVERLLRHGGLHVAGRPCTGDALPASVAAGSPIVAWTFAWEPEPVTIGPADVLLDAEGAVAVRKPAWLPVQATRASLLVSVEAGLRALLACPALTAVHRLDRETSGVLLFARDAGTAARLGRRFARGEVRKRYHAVVSPAPDAESWLVRGHLARSLHPTRIAFALHPAPGPGRRPSETRFALRSTRHDRALVEAQPRTGRSHQIRVHLAAGGTPIAGDPLYGAGGAVREPERERDERLQLHATSLSLRLGAAPGAPEVEIHAPWPHDFAHDFGREHLP